MANLNINDHDYLNIDYQYLLTTNVLLDLGNFLIISIVILYLCNINNINRKYSFLLLLHCSLPFFLNNFLFDINYMPDQVKYAFRTNWFRFSLYDSDVPIIFSMHDQMSTYITSKTGFFSWFISLFPLPNSESIRFVGFANKLLFGLLFIYLFKKKILSNRECLFYLFYPSFALYSGLNLREMASVFFLIILIEKCYNFKNNIESIFIIIFSILFLYICKFQLLIFVFPILFILLFDICGFKNKGFSFKVYFLIFLITSCLSYIFFKIYGEDINSLRFSFHLDSGLSKESFYSMESYFDLIYLFIKGFYTALFTFAPGEKKSIFITLQFLENIIVIFIIFIFSYYGIRSNLKKAILWMSFLIFSLGMNGLLVTNYGTISRYKFSIILVYLIFINYTHKEKKNENLPNMFN